MSSHKRFFALLFLLPLCGCPQPKRSKPGSGQPVKRAKRELVILDALNWSAKYLEAGGIKLKRIDGSVRLAAADPERTAAVLAGACLALRRRLTIISGNVANAETTRLPVAAAGAPATPYRRKVLTVTASGGLEVAEDKSGFRKAYRPGHPDADKDGNVLLPNVYLAVEMHDWRASRREYETLRLALVTLSNSYVAPPAALLSEPVPPPPYEAKKLPPPPPPKKAK